MSRQFLKQSVFSLLLSSKQKRNTGFTMIELLVALFIGSVITGGLLFMVVKLLETNQREASRSDTQREVQMAMDYISRDLREAVYVYDGRCLVKDSAAVNTSQNCTGLLDYLPEPISGEATTLPVLAFWKVEDLPQNLKTNCSNNAAAFSSTAALPVAVAGVPCISRRMYTLVVYTLDWTNGDNWKGKARIKRYNLPQFSDSAGAGGTQPEITKGWLYPAGENTGFNYWPNNKDYKPIAGYVVPVAATNANNQVLLDFVDKNPLIGGDVTCPNDYTVTPASASARGFYVCVKGAESNGKLNQEVIIRIQGNVAGRPGASNANIPLPIETRVLTRGVLNKNI
ncbi:PilW family protein [Myxacorys almedinensis]|uniref:Prepilin-type N-terminal cleavage/methylation domain-containing protein n=1 Tax=Myxacorys almedinensis A TaxID=2690445 RepID=A0A8J7YY66_9CYAN|nr:prepilin-type N-terminal cleavage/methylation domain-containing protein [Myxacorys almedinensis]NDJ16269.1 prepilin-type N-terminal cleavage/methylation domain-containing protein [Myxacorys almedinensis A]